MRAGNLLYSWIYFTLMTSILLVFNSCEDEAEPPLDCSGFKLNLVSKNDISNCNVEDGEVVVTASGGVEPYTYDLSGVKNSTGSFSNLKAGTYTINVISGDENCKASLEVFVGIVGSDFTATGEGTGSTVCAPNSNGFITVAASNGVEPYRYRAGNGPYVNENIIPGLGPGTYMVEIIDDVDCSINITVQVPGMRYETIKSLIELNCAVSGCHNGAIGAHNNYLLFDNVKENSIGIRATTTDKTMPPPGSGNLSQEQIDLIACWVAEGANK